ncbi:MAG: hypothetical protein M1370_02340 [Bacteroidetes bacterium]|nr:hypothetical protein [Bacteroidota bacterium]MCL5025095.1 hypothetical protein [Chloroflexota bacterium]
MDSRMQIVDTHVHVGQYWYEPVETLLFQMDHHFSDEDRTWIFGQTALSVWRFE